MPGGIGTEKANLNFSLQPGFILYIFTNFYVFTKITMYGDYEKRYL